MIFHPSIYAHMTSGGIFLLSIAFLIFYFSKISSRDPYQILVLSLLFSIAIGIHGISHIGLESLYGYDPYFLITGKIAEPWHPLDCPCKRMRNCPFLN